MREMRSVRLTFWCDQAADPSLLSRMPRTEGFLCIIAPLPDKLGLIKESLLTQDEFEVTPATASAAATSASPCSADAAASSLLLRLSIVCSALPPLWH